LSFKNEKLPQIQEKNYIFVWALSKHTNGICRLRDPVIPNFLAPCHRYVCADVEDQPKYVSILTFWGSF